MVNPAQPYLTHKTHLTFNYMYKCTVLCMWKVWMSVVWLGLLKLTCVGDDNTWCNWSPPPPPTLVGTADEGTPVTTAVVMVPPEPWCVSDCDDDGSSLCVWCCVVVVGDEEEFAEVATEFCCPPAAIEYAGPWGNEAGFDAPLGLELPFEGGAPVDIDLPNEFDLLGVVLVGVVILFPPLDVVLDGILELSGNLFTGFFGDDATTGGGYMCQNSTLLTGTHPPTHTHKKVVLLYFHLECRN